MASSKKFAMGAAGAAGGDALNVENVFSTTMYDGTSSSQDITNGIDLSTEGGLVWTKRYENAGSSSSTFTQYLFDTDRGGTKALFPYSTSAEITNAGFITAFNTDGFTVGNNTNINYSGDRFLSWTFRKAPKFFDVVTYTGNGSAGRTVDHNLDSEVGMLIVKETSSNGNWWVYHRGVNSGTNPAQYVLQLSSANGQVSYSGAWNNTAPTTTSFTLGNDGSANQSGASYVAYLWAHNDGDGVFGPTGDQDIIKCGYVDYTLSGGATVDLGFEPQFVMTKAISTTGNWIADDEKYGLTYGFRGKRIDWDGTTGASSNAANCEPTANGFNMFPSVYNNSTHIYVAVRRGPMAVPTDATDVFAIDDRSGGPPNAVAGFPVDMGLYTNITTEDNRYISTRHIQAKRFFVTSSSLMSNSSEAKFDYQNGFINRSDSSTDTLHWMWRRAPGFFDVVTYKGDGQASREIKHNLGADPEMIIFKNLSYTYDAPLLWNKWPYWNPSIPHQTLSFLYYMNTTGVTAYSLDALNSSNASGQNSYVPTDTSFWVGNSRVSNRSGDYITALVFGSLDGVSKVGTYLGNSSNNSSGSQTIDCGFSNGAKFVLIKSLGQTQPWQLFDTTRGINAGTDKMLELNNSAAAERTWYDWVDSDSSGFIVNNFGDSGYNLNINNNRYIYYAVAA